MLSTAGLHVTCRARTILLNDSGLEFLVDRVRLVEIESITAGKTNVESEVEIAAAVAEVGS